MFESILSFIGKNKNTIINVVTKSLLSLAYYFENRRRVDLEKKEAIKSEKNEVIAKAIQIQIDEHNKDIDSKYNAIIDSIKARK